MVAAANVMKAEMVKNMRANNFSRDCMAIGAMLMCVCVCECVCVCIEEISWGLGIELEEKKKIRRNLMLR